MGEDRVSAAIARLERALARLEAASDRAPPTSLFENNDLTALKARHDTLRGDVEGAIARIDSLIQAAERN